MNFLLGFLHYSNTTLVKVKFKQLRKAINKIKIQIQLLLKLNPHQNLSLLL